MVHGGAPKSELALQNHHNFSFKLVAILKRNLTRTFLNNRE
jgi:hypothetical protein